MKLLDIIPWTNRRKYLLKLTILTKIFKLKKPSHPKENGSDLRSRPNHTHTRSDGPKVSQKGSNLVQKILNLNFRTIYDIELILAATNRMKIKNIRV